MKPNPGVTAPEPPIEPMLWLTPTTLRSASMQVRCVVPESAVPPIPPGSLAAANVAHAASIGTASGMSRTGDPQALPAVPKNRGALVAVAGLLVLGAIGVATVVTLARKPRAPDGAPVGVALAPPPVAVPATASVAATLTEEPKSAPPASAAGSVAAVASTGPARPGPAVSVHAAGARVVNPPPAGSSAPPRTAGPKPIDLGY